MSDAIRLPNFQNLTSLYQDDPHAFEHFRMHLLREAIDSALPVHRPALEALLDQINRDRLAVDTPANSLQTSIQQLFAVMQELETAWSAVPESVAEWEAAALIARVATSSKI